MMTKTIATIKITIFLPTGELEIARIIRDSCRKKPNWTVLASAAVRVLLVTGSVTCSAPLPIGLYTVVRGAVAFAVCNSYTRPRRIAASLLQSFAQQRHAAPNFRKIDRAVAKPQPCLGLRSEKVAAQGMNLHLLPQQSCLHGFKIEGMLRQRGNVHAVVRGNGSQPLTKTLLQQLQQQWAAQRVEVAHFSHMTGQMALGYESRHRALNRRWTMPIQAILCSREGTHRPTGCHDVPQPQRRQHALRECADIEHHVRGSSSAQCRQWAAFIAKFPVIIVFDDDRSAFARKLDQGLPSAQRHCHAEGKLMGWGNTNYPHVGGQLLDDQTFLIDPHGSEFRAGGGKRHSHRRVTGIFQRNGGFMRRNQRPGQQIKRLLSAGSDEYVFCLACDRSRDRDVLDDCPAKMIVALISLRALVAGGSAFQSAQLLGADAAKYIQWKEP